MRLPGYVVPLDGTRGERREFLLVPHLGACIHSPPPPANQIVHVSLPEHAMDLQTMDTVWVTGSISTARQDSVMGRSGYHIAAIKVERYRGDR